MAAASAVASSGSRKTESSGIASDKAMLKGFKAWLKGKPVAAERKQQSLDDEDTERLRALGYIE